MKTREAGFAPVYGAGSKVLILGSFPSVKSRAVGFYYGNPQNRFWRTVCGFFGEEIPPTIEGKTEFLVRRKIALWDVVLSCKIEGSSDSSIEEEEVADLPSVLRACGAGIILCNGSKSYDVLAREYPDLLTITKKLSSTSPANPRFSAEEWKRAFNEIFG